MSTATNPFPRLRRRSIAIAIVLVMAMIPFRTTTVPNWRIRFVDELGKPLSSLPVVQTWRNYSVEQTDHNADGITDQDGYVQFPKRTLWAPLMMRILGPIESVIGSGAHASFGQAAWILPKCGLQMRGSRLPTYWGKDLPGRVVLGYNESTVRFNSDPRCQLATEQTRGAESQAR